MRLFVSPLLAWFLSFLSASAWSQSSEDFFEAEIRPLLAEHCWNCHGSETQWNGLRLDSIDAIMRGGDSGAALVPGNPDASLLYRAVLRNQGLEMPPEDPLSERQVQAIRIWIESGAAWPANSEAIKADDHGWKGHWAFQPVQPCSPPPVSDPSWCRNEIDRFILSKLDSLGLRPSTEADRRTLIRRATIDATGLPPTFDEVQQFLQDEHPDAYVKMIDRLLASPRFGEQHGRSWLDIARYSDTKGYVYAREERHFVHASEYRDWVIESFNQDLPYDQFIRLQLAADQWGSTPQSLRAMGFLTLGRRFLGVKHEIIDDRIDLVGRGLMGLTIGCARCHDHKYDPIPTTDYYALYGVLNNCTERQVELEEPSAHSDVETEFQKELSARKRALEEKLASSRQAASDRVRKRLADYLYAQTELSNYPAEGFDVILSAEDITPAFVRRWNTFLLARSDLGHPIWGPWTRCVAMVGEPRRDELRQVADQIANDSRYHPWVQELFREPPSSLKDIAERYGRLLNSIDEERKRIMSIPSSEWKLGEQDWLAASEPFSEVIEGNDSPCNVPDEEIVDIESFFDSNSCTELWRLQGEIDRWRLSAPDQSPLAVGLFDRRQIAEQRVFKRGNPANKGSLVERRFLSLFPEELAKPFEHGSGRLELAARIADSNNPLTARVCVNRIWQHYFGRGLVNTSSDFGLRAEPPSHPELLDWLAKRLVEEHWSIKSIHKLILQSATYRQASQTEANDDRVVDAQRIDADNRYLWRMQPRRLRFEELRDSMLHVSSGLSETRTPRSLDMFATDDSNRSRSVYGFIDRQFMPTILRVFDFANPDLHVSKRSETFIPQQSLYFLNHPFAANRAREIEACISDTLPPKIDPRDFVRVLYERVLQRRPDKNELHAAMQFLDHSDQPPVQLTPESAVAWQYGIGEYDENTRLVKNFTPLPYFSGQAWQGGPMWPDKKFGWAQLTALGGHPGNDRSHACIRRWTAPREMTIQIQSNAIHEHSVGDGVRCRIISSRSGCLSEELVHARQSALNIDNYAVKQGETIDFYVDILSELNTDQFLWSSKILQVDNIDLAAGPPVVPSELSQPQTWDAAKDFAGPAPRYLSRAAQLAQILLMTNEFWFRD